MCSDPLITWLKDKGYNAVRLPKADLRAGQLMMAVGGRAELQLLGALATVFATDDGTPAPTVTAGLPVAGMSGEKSNGLNIGVGLTLLGGFLGAMGGSAAGLEAAYKGARTLSFSFPAAAEERLEPAALDKFLAAADAQPFAPGTLKLLEADDVYVLTAVLRSKSFTVSATAKTESEFSLNLPDVQQAVGGKIKVDGQGAKNVKLSYEGDTELTFGFRAVRLQFRDGRYVAFVPVKAAGLIAAAPRGRPAAAPGAESAKKRELLSVSGPFVRV